MHLPGTLAGPSVNRPEKRPGSGRGSPQRRPGEVIDFLLFLYTLLVCFVTMTSVPRGNLSAMRPTAELALDTEPVLNQELSDDLIIVQFATMGDHVSNLVEL